MADDCRCPEPAVAGKWKAEEEALEAADRETDEMPAPDVKDDDYPIWNLNRMTRQNLMTPEWFEEKKKEHYEHVAFMHKVYDKLLQPDDDVEEDDEATLAQLDDICTNIFANVDLSGLNTAGGESCGVDAVGVFLGNDAHAAPPESSS